MWVPVIRQEGILPLGMSAGCQSENELTISIIQGIQSSITTTPALKTIINNENHLCQIFVLLLSIK